MFSFIDNSLSSQIPRSRTEVLTAGSIPIGYNLKTDIGFRPDPHIPNVGGRVELVKKIGAIE
jgi:hypothetical protein